VLEFGRQFDAPPRYFVYGGLTFVVLSRDVLETWGSNWISEMPDHLRYLFIHVMDLNRDPRRKEYVILSEILPDEVNTYAGPYEHRVLEAVNGEPIYRLEDVPPALEKAKDGYAVFTFMDRKRPLVLDAAQAAERTEPVLENYNVPADRRLEG
jgi:hypothetical protein